MKQREVTKRIAKAAKAKGISWELVRQGGNHEVWELGGTVIPIPRHRELGNRVAEMIWKECEAHLGKGWWR